MKNKLINILTFGISKKVARFILPVAKYLLDRRDNLNYSCHPIVKNEEMKILLFLSEGPREYGEIIAFCENLKIKKVKKTLNHLEFHQMITRTDIGTEGRKFSYSIALRGTSCIPYINERITWSIADKILEDIKKKKKLQQLQYVIPNS